MPIGGIILYNGLFSAIPTNFALCNGSNGTPNLTDRFVYGTNSEAQSGTSGGFADSVAVSHNHSGSTSSTGSHNHTLPFNTLSDISGGGATLGFRGGGTTATSTSGSHSHSLTINSAGVSGVNRNIPPYVKLAYIQRIT